MAQEYQSSRFFDINKIGLTYYAAQMSLEKFIAANIFRGDLSRIMFTADTFAFRARYEQTDKSIAYNGASSLNFPFCNYWYEGYWDKDDRSAAMQARQILVGASDGTQKIRAYAVKAKITSTFYFDTDSESRIAYDNLRWLFLPRSVVIATNVKYKSTSVPIPLIVELESLSFNPAFTERDWLEKNRIIPFTATFIMRSFVIGPNVQTPITNGLNPTLVDSTGVEAITEQSLLYFVSSKNLMATDQGTLELSLAAYFNPSYDITINSITTSNVTFSNATINWNLSLPLTADPTSLSQIVIKMQGRADIIINNPALTGSQVISGLNELSNYTAYVYLILASKKVKSQSLTFTTANNPATPDNTGLSSITTLKGVTF